MVCLYVKWRSLGSCGDDNYNCDRREKCLTSWIYITGERGRHLLTAVRECAFYVCRYINTHTHTHTWKRSWNTDLLNLYLPEWCPEQGHLNLKAHTLCTARGNRGRYCLIKSLQCRNWSPTKTADAQREIVQVCRVNWGGKSHISLVSVREKGRQMPTATTDSTGRRQFLYRELRLEGRFWSE
jgi:hypothetical protein